MFNCAQRVRQEISAIDRPMENENLFGKIGASITDDDQVVLLNQIT